MQTYQNTNMPVISGNSGYAIFFDNIRVDQFVESFSVNLGIEVGMGSANINMIYVPDFDKVIHTQNADKVSNVVEQAAKKSEENIKKIEKAEVINCSTLTVRSGPNTSYKPVTYVQAGTIMEVIGRGGDGNSWVKVKTGSATGFVSGKYVRIFEDTQKSSTEQTISKTEKSGNVTSIGDSTVDKGLNIVLDDGIENMTNVRIYIKNMFSQKYQQVFAGNITGKSITISGSERKLNFVATDYMNWLNKTICPIAVPLDSTLALGDRLRWKAQGIDISKVSTVSSINEVSFKGKSLAQTWQSISEQAIKTNALYTDPETVSYFDNVLSKVIVMGDIDENLRKKEVIDFLISSSISSVNSVYVLMNDIIRQLVFEFYQDIDESIKIKPPFWNQHVLNSHVIDAALILSYTESTDYNSMYTRVIATGGLDEWHRGANDRDLTALIQTPVVAVTSSGLATNSGPTVVTTELQNRIGMEHGSNIATSAVQIALMQEGKYYIWGADGPDTFDCSGLIHYCYKKAGYPMQDNTANGYMNQFREVANIQDLCPGDLLQPWRGHIQMYIGGGKVIGADGGDEDTNQPTESAKVKITNLRSSYIKMVRVVEWDGIANVNDNKEVYTESVGDDALLKPTLMEKKYGPKILDCSQPLIKFSTSAATSSSDPYDALSKYARFMLNYMNSNVVVASIQVNAMPWIRPGFNIWVDPVAIDKIYYVNSITHQGGPGGVYTTINGTMGRRRHDFINNKDMIGSLKPGKSDDIFINEIKITPEKYGKVCDYNDVLVRAHQFYNTQKTEHIEVTPYNSYYNHFYGGTSAKEATSTAKPTIIGSPALRSSPAIDVKNMNANLISFLSDGMEVKIIGFRNEWVNISTSVGTGWVLTNSVRNATADKVESMAASTAPKDPPKPINKGKVINITTYLNVRSGPGTNYSIIGKLFNNDEIVISKESNGFYSFSYNGKEGWASAKYIKKTSEPQKISENNQNQQATPPLSATASGQALPGEFTINDIQYTLNVKYNAKATPQVVKNRCKRLRELTESASIYMARLYRGNSIDNPICLTRGGLPPW